MKKFKKVNKWELSFIAFDKKFKVTRRVPELSVSETRIFKTKKEAKHQFDEWLK